jgi:hypothetical protein
MIAGVRTAYTALAAMLCVSWAAYGSRPNYSETQAWTDASALIVRGSISSADYGPDTTARYELRILEILKPRELNLRQITITDHNWRTTAAISLRTGGEFLLYLVHLGDEFHSYREVDLQSPGGMSSLRGVRAFLKVMYTSEPAQQRQLCVDAWKTDLSEPEQQGILDAMWETKTPLYSDQLLSVANGKASPRVRAWAITILAYLGNARRVEELVPLLLDDPNYDVKRQLLLLFGIYRIQGALASIDRLLRDSPPATLLPWQTTNLRAMAQEARGKITGEDTNPGWRN